MHRPSNVDDPQTLERLLKTLETISETLPLVFPLHPRTEKCIASAGLEGYMQNPRLLALPPVGYLEMLGLMRDAKLVLTDSGGIQEETTALGVPCITLRENTERPITVEEGTNTIVGSDPGKILACFEDVMATGGKGGRVPEYWDGKAAERIAAVLADWAGARQAA
jgi:UDP-N-acetylglucosamine 2-epimerase (non-hydrolysing)